MSLTSHVSRIVSICHNQLLCLPFSVFPLFYAPVCFGGHWQSERFSAWEKAENSTDLTSGHPLAFCQNESALFIVSRVVQ
jgi:hypothetical protein